MPDSSKLTRFILLGASGDLAQKKILPALATLTNLNVTLWSRKILTYEVQNQYNKYQIIQSDYTDQESWTDLLSKNQGQHFIIYLALPPISYLGILETLSQCLDNSNYKLDIIIEKPFATNSANMKEIIELINSNSSLNGKVHLFDHFLFKDSLESIKKSWITETINSVICRSLEVIDVVGRAAFYDQTGATRDMISHLMFFSQKFCEGLGYHEKFQWGKYNITRYQVLQYTGYNDNSELECKISTTETFFDLELSNPDLQPSKIQLTSGKKQPQKIWDITVNDINYDLMLAESDSKKQEHLNMIQALERQDYTKFVSYTQALEMWELIDRLVLTTVI